MSVRSRSAVLSIGTAVAIAWSAAAQGPAPQSPAGSRAHPAAEPPAVATVGLQSISRAEFESGFEEALKSYRQRTSNEIPKELRPVMRRQYLEVLIRQRLARHEAQRRAYTISYDEAESQLKQDPAFQTRGLFDEAKFLAIKSSRPTEFDKAVEELRRTLPARRVIEALERENRPEEAAIRARVARKLNEVTLDVLALRLAEFDGHYPEPAETAILDYYRAHTDEFRRAEHVNLSLVYVNQPLEGSLAGDAAAARAWESRMRQRADSALAAVRDGAMLDSVALAFDGLKRAIGVERSSFPRYWRGNARVTEAVFSLAPGSLLPEPVPAASGFLLVRVDERTPAGVAPLRDVAGGIRSRLRAEARAHGDEGELRALYDQVRDSLRGPAYRIRYAVADAGAMTAGEPSPAELDRFHRGHLADYSAFDAASGTVVATPLAQVRDDVRRRWITERREVLMRTAAERLSQAWGRGRRDAAAERAMTFVREVGPVPVGGVVDSGLAGATLTDTLVFRRELGVGLAPFARGLIVYHVFAEVRDHTPAFDQVRPLLAQRLAERHERRDEAGARALYDRDPGQFRTGNILRFTRLVVGPPELLAVPLTREEVETYYARHIDKYAAPEVARARHILVSPTSPTPAADAEARRKAEDLLKRVRAGESFAELARQYSDDPATRENGGDVGVFGHGMMLDEFERVAFRMRPGDLEGPVRTEAGYHIIMSLEHARQELTPLPYCYTNVAVDAALEKSEAVGRQRADSLWRSFKTPAQATAVAQRHGFLLIDNEHTLGEKVYARDLTDYFAKLETVKPGQFYPGIQLYKGLGHVITWVDRILPPMIPRWDDARTAALDRYRNQAGLRAMQAKRAEMDSLEGAGWSVDSLAALWGGFEHLPSSPAGTPLPRLGGRELVDSLAFGGTRPPVLKAGDTADWIEFPAGFARLRLLGRHGPDPIQLTNRVESERRLTLERNLKIAFEKLKQRFPVRILDSELRATPLPEISEP